MSRKKLFAFTFCALALFFGGAEIVFRLFDFQFYFSTSANILGLPVLSMSKFVRVSSKAVEYDAQLFWKIKPNLYLTDKTVYKEPVKINSMGTRGAEFTPNKPKDTYRILCLGDSVTFGWSIGEGEPYPSVLSKLLTEIHPDKNFEVINMGVPGYSSRQGLEYLRLKGTKWQPDLIIFAFGPNDKFPALKSDKELLESKAFDISPLTSLLAKSQVYKILRSGVILAKHYVQAGGLSDKEFIPHLKRKVNAREFAQNLEDARKLSWEAGAEFMMLNVGFPARPMDEPYEEVNKAAKEAGIKGSADFSKPMNLKEIITEYSKTEALPFLDLNALFADQLELIKSGHADPEMKAHYETELKELIKKEPYYYIMVDPGHPNEWGHRLIAQAIYSKLVHMEGFGLFTGVNVAEREVYECIPEGMDVQPKAAHAFVGEMDVGEIAEGSSLLMLKLKVKAKYISVNMQDLSQNIWLKVPVENTGTLGEETTPDDEETLDDESQVNQPETIILVVNRNQFNGSRGFWAVLLDDAILDDGSESYKFKGACEL